MNATETLEHKYGSVSFIQNCDKHASLDFNISMFIRHVHFYTFKNALKLSSLCSQKSSRFSFVSGSF